MGREYRKKYKMGVKEKLLKISDNILTLLSVSMIIGVIYLSMGYFFDFYFCEIIKKVIANILVPLFVIVLVFNITFENIWRK
jgi:vacuolar-type H+-ATPase subunit I/STV1